MSTRGDGIDGVQVDFEVVSGPGDDDIGTAGNTPASPDLSCTSSGGGPGNPSTCTVSYTESDNAEGTDAILAWIDDDGFDATVEADSGEGREDTGEGSPRCAPDTQGPGSTPEPDGTDCVEKRWTTRVARFVDVQPESATAQAGATHTLVASVLDQDGNPLTGAGTDTEVGFYFLPGSPNDPANPGLTGPYDLSCSTGTTGSCSVSYTALATGTDLVCGFLPAAPTGQCRKSLGAPDGANRADVVERITTPAWGPLPPVLALSGSGSSRTGQGFMVTAVVTSPSGSNVGGTLVDFEVTTGPGDDDVGSAGNTPGSPDLSCTAVNTGPGTASCSVSYTEGGNVGGADAILGWIDGDGSNATVEADLGEGSDPSAAATPGCMPGSQGAGSDPEPDDTDCMQHAWTERVATFLDIQPESGSGQTEASHLMSAVIRDQDGNLFAGPGTSTAVSFNFLTGSPNDPGSPGLGGPPDLACSTGTAGACSSSYVGSSPGTDTICGYLPGSVGQCSEAPGAPESQNGADVVLRLWQGVGGSGGGSDEGDPAGSGTQDSPPATEVAEGEVPAPEAENPPGSVPGGGSQPGAGKGLGIGAGPDPGTHEGTTRPADPEAHHPLGQAIESIEKGLERLVEAAAATATTFGFPLSLAVLVLVFLMFQNRLDRKDPKLANAPLHSYQDVARFTDGNGR